MFGIKRPFKSLKLGTGLELELDDQNFLFTSATTGEKLLQGNYPYRSSHFSVQRYNASHINPDLTWLENFGMFTFDQVSQTIPGLREQSILDSIVKKNSSEHLKRCLSVYEKKKKKQMYL